VLISIVSVLISSIALAGVAVSLLLQARQLRASHIQAARTSQLERIKFYLNDPNPLINVEGIDDIDKYKESMHINWYVSHSAFVYENRAVSRTYLQTLARNLFKSETSREWRREYGYTYRESVTSRRDKDFFLIFDQEFQRAIQSVNPIKNDSEASSDENK
jgi:hypothetical protein